LKRPSAWDRVLAYPTTTSYSRLYGSRSKEPNREHAEKLTEKMLHDVLFDNFDEYGIECYVHPFEEYYETVIKFTCNNVYDTECNMVIP